MSAGPDAMSPPRLPGGTVTFVFTDVEGSTARWERDGAAMQTALRRHDEIVRAAIVGNGGHVFKTIGDAFCAAFARSEDAVAAMLAAQRALAAEDFSAVGGMPVRAAVHTGTTDERDGDYFGPPVNRVARLLAIAHGGQVLLSGVTTDLVQSALPPGATLRDLGEHRLKDLTRSERVYQLLAPELPSEFPPLRSLEGLRHNLPVQFTTFVGRDSEIADIAALFDAHRLVTLVGSGGIGKTRTSLHVAANMLDRCTGGVWFVELAPVVDGAHVPGAIAQAFGHPLAAEGDPAAELARAIGADHMMLVFDNCEHVVEPTARLVATLLRECANLKILASSRQALGIAGERAFRLPSLAVPHADAAGRLTASEARQCAAVALFVDRARAADHRFAFDDDNAPVIAEICRRLDGIPLAIELAAARIKLLSPRQMRERLNERFRMLTGGNRDVMPRQQTLRALIDWSHDLLDERERILFRRLAIFASGFTLEGAAAVGTIGGGLDELDVFDLLASLVDKSLVLAEPAGDALRYRLLESTRVYALEKLDAAFERAACAQRNLLHLRDRFASARRHWERTARSIEMDAALANDFEDVRAMLAAALENADAVAGAELLAEVGRGWSDVGLANEGIAHVVDFLAALPASATRLLARLSVAAAALAGDCGQALRQLEFATDAVAHARACGHDATLAEALHAYSFCLSRQGRYDEVEAALAEAEAIGGLPTALRLRLLEARAFVNVRRDPAAAARAYEQLRIEHRALGNALSASMMTLNLTEVEHASGRTDRAIALTREELPGLRAQSDRRILAMALENLAGYLVAVDDLPGAIAAAHEAIRELAPREAEGSLVAIAIEHLALALALGDDARRAARLAAYADAALRRHGLMRGFTEAATHDRLVVTLRERAPDPDDARVQTDGSDLTSESAVALALA